MNYYQPINSHIIGIVMREAVRRACAIIRKKRFDFEFKEKEVDYKSGQDFVSSADFEAQQIYLDLLKKNFPDFGIIAEEDDLFTDAVPFMENGVEHRFYFTIDPLDGTKAFLRGQSDGYASMLGLIHQSGDTKTAIAACIGDPMTGEMYYTRPDSPRAHLLSSEQEQSRKLSFNEDGLVTREGRYLLLRENIAKKHTDSIKSLIDDNGIFKDFELVGGSIGISFAKLWKGQYAGLALKAGSTTVWDTTPCIAISKKLGFVPLIVNADGKFEKSDFVVSSKRESIPQAEMVIVHETIADEILKHQG